MDSNIRKDLSKLGMVAYFLGILNRKRRKLIIWHPITWIVIIYLVIIYGIHELLENEEITYKIR